MSKTVSLVEKKISDFVESIRPPHEVRNQVDIGYIFEKNVLEVFERRPRWDNENEFIENSVVRSRFIKSRDLWKIYWKRASGKWESYEPCPEVNTIEEVFKILNEDDYGCFFG
ncbi:DUF3024 domain-containing protein [Flammeovirga sp. MY04]|uniref:DUF3024 domain-containing protein n=1 Tax=Flammeovirga sp. MY04 TaxID=1191459 RepID=UPI0008063C7A|nr:DUF3024 domain-containing protein [Flammeovirga sp. MY04]ANQ51699.1 DUF3024 domain-containing protein [Flammeovirga sp. MY04]